LFADIVSRKFVVSDVDKLLAALNASGSNYMNYEPHLADLTVSSTLVPIDLLSAAEAARQAHPDIGALVLLAGGSARPDQVDWLAEHGPFEIIIREYDYQYRTTIRPLIAKNVVYKKDVYIIGDPTIFGLGSLAARFIRGVGIAKVAYRADVPLDSAIAANATAEAMMSEFYQETRSKNSKPYGVINNPLVGGHRINEAAPSKQQCYYTVCSASTTLGRSFLWKARQLRFKADVSLSNLGGYRQTMTGTQNDPNFTNGTVFIGDCINTLKFMDKLEVYTTLGKDLYSNVKSLTRTEGRGLIGAGFRVAFNEPCRKFVNHSTYGVTDRRAPGTKDELQKCATEANVKDPSIVVIDMQIAHVDFDACTDWNTCDKVEWRRLEKGTTYTIVTRKFVASLLGGFTLLPNNLPSEANALCDYIIGNTPLNVEPFADFHRRGTIQYESPEAGWADGARIVSVKSPSSLIENAPTCPDDVLLAAKASTCEPCPAGTQSIADPARNKCDPCALGFFSNSSGQKACAILMVEVKTQLTNKDGLVRLWLHECCRQFRDRLINKDDRQWFNKCLAELVEVHVGAYLQLSWPSETFDTLVFGDFFSRDVKAYVISRSEQRLHDTFKDYLEECNSVNPCKMNLVFFKDAQLYLARVARIIRQPRGSALLVGVSGIGRKSMARMAAHMADFTCKSIEITRIYGKNEFRDDTQAMMMSVMEKDGKGLVFLFSDTQIVKESFFEDINSVLNTGEVPNLFAPDEAEQVIGYARPLAKAAGKMEDRDTIWQHFVQLIRESLHIVLAFSPIGEGFRARCRQFPSIINCASIDWCDPWPEDALVSVAQLYYKQAPNLLQLASMLGPLAQVSALIHSSSQAVAEEFFENLRRRTYMTPTSYLELIRLFIDLLGLKKGELSTKLSRYKVGAQRLDETKTVVDKLKIDLTRMQPTIEQGKKDTAELIIQVDKEEGIAKEKAAACEIDEMEASAAAGDWQVLTSFDASFAREPGMKSQLGFMTFLTTGPVEQEETVCNIAEFQSSTIHRVVKSTLAAEAASMSTALDRQLYLRLLLEAILYGEPACGPDWRHRLKIPGILIADARSLYDHLNKTGSAPKEKRILIDLLVARDLTEANALKLRWTPTTHMLADILTKETAMTVVFGKFLKDGLYCLTQTAEEQELEEHRKELRQGQRRRRREHKAGARRG